MEPKVIHPHAVEIAMQANMPFDSLYVLRRQRNVVAEHGSCQAGIRKQLMDRYVTGIAYACVLTQMTVMSEKDNMMLHSCIQGYGPAQN